ncbi:MAG TPA: hypothetical protein VFP97_07340 [Chitinophagaceae bacterium]|nr:hypothetical protein [Chitinophagaceae bacterium]
MKKLIAIMAAGILLSACHKNNHESFKDELTTQEKIVIPAEENSIARNSQKDQYNTCYGPTVQFGNGHVRSWVNIAHDNTPLGIGIEFTDGVLDQQHIHGNDETHGHEVLLVLHQKAKALLPFDHLTMGFMAAGHPPPGIYSIPHFDFHFYKMSLADRLAIPTYSQAMTAFNNNPPGGYLPPAYVKGPAGEAQMGAHWMDVLSPEFNGRAFTHTFIYGSYDGKVNFLEPMASLAFLMGGTAAHQAIRQPQFFDPTNTYYPTRYNIWKNQDNNRHYIALDQMVLR